jgi:hypothetical protein
MELSGETLTALAELARDVVNNQGAGYGNYWRRLADAAESDLARAEQPAPAVVNCTCPLPCEWHPNPAPAAPSSDTRAGYICPQCGSDEWVARDWDGDRELRRCSACMITWSAWSHAGEAAPAEPEASVRCPACGSVDWTDVDVGYRCIHCETRWFGQPTAPSPPAADPEECPAVEQIIRHHQSWADYGMRPSRPRAVQFHEGAVKVIRALAASESAPAAEAEECPPEMPQDVEPSTLDEVVRACEDRWGTQGEFAADAEGDWSRHAAFIRALAASEAKLRERVEKASAP